VATRAFPTTIELSRHIARAVRESLRYYCYAEELQALENIVGESTTQANPSAGSETGEEKTEEKSMEED